MGVTNSMAQGHGFDTNSQFELIYSDTKSNQSTTDRQRSLPNKPRLAVVYTYHNLASLHATQYQVRVFRGLSTPNSAALQSADKRSTKPLVILTITNTDLDAHRRIVFDDLVLVQPHLLQINVHNSPRRNVLPIAARKIRN